MSRPNGKNLHAPYVLGMVILMLSQASAAGLYIPYNLEKKVLKQPVMMTLNGLVSMPGPGMDVAKVILRFSSKPDEAGLKELGIIKLFGSDTWFTAFVPWNNLGLLAATLTNLRTVERPQKPILHSITGAEVSLLKATNLIANGFDGTGITIAVIDGGFYKYSECVASGDLPVCVTINHSTQVFEDSSAGTDSAHGTACAEIIHEIAPGAKLVLIKIEDSSGLYNAIDDCLDQGVRIVSMSMGWFNDGWGSGDGYIYTTFAEPLYGKGVLWINSAGNQAQMHYQASFNDNGSWHQFPDGNNYGIVSNVGNGETLELFLKWNSWNAYRLGVSYNDYNLYLYSSPATNTLVTASTEVQPGNPPGESLFYQNSSGITRNYYYRIKRITGPGQDQFQVCSASHDIGPWDSRRSIMSPADGDKVLCVAATRYSNWTSKSNFHAEYFSSRGPTQDGRIKPDISGIDGVNGYVASNYWLQRFFGTSAACPSVVGLAGLVLSKQPYMSPYQLAWTLKDNADSSLMSAAPDTTNGWGKARVIMMPIRRNSDTLASNVIVAPTRITGKDRKLYYYGVSDKTTISLKSVLGATVKDFTPLPGAYATGANYLDLSGLRLAPGIYMVVMTSTNGIRYERKIVVSQ